jgi:hypothetical protein
MSDAIESSTVNEQTGGVNPADTIASMIAANRQNVQKPVSAEQPPAGQEEAKAESPEAAPELEAEPENVNGETEEAVETENTEEPSEGDSDPVNFFEFADENPNLKIRIPNKNAEGGFVEITAKKAATLLGQTSDIDENSRKLKASRAEFEEYEANRRKELDGLQIGLELTIVPQLQSAADELVTLQGYNQQWKNILDQATDEVQRAEAQAAIRQNQSLIEEKSKFIQTNRPKVDQFYKQRSQYVQQQLDNARQSFTDKELANKANFNELRDKLSKDWKAASSSFVPGVPNIDLVSSDEYLLGLIRDGMKFREGPKVKNAGGSLAAATKIVAKAKTAPKDETSELQERANRGDKNAGRDLLAKMLSANKQRRR